jgi:hypothetical protein
VEKLGLRARVTSAELKQPLRQLQAQVATQAGVMAQLAEEQEKQRTQVGCPRCQEQGRQRSALVLGAPCSSVVRRLLQLRGESAGLVCAATTSQHQWWSMAWLQQLVLQLVRTAQHSCVGGKHHISSCVSCVFCESAINRRLACRDYKAQWRQRSMNYFAV